MKRLIAGLFSVAFVVSTAFAITGILRGRVVDEKGNPMVDVSVILEAAGGQKFSLKTNKKGEYIQVGLNGGLWKVSVTKEGYKPQSTQVNVALGDETRAPEITLVPGSSPAAKGPDIQKDFDAANKLAAAGDFDGALAGLEAVLAKGPSRADVVYLTMGEINRKKGDASAAEAAYKKALELKPGSLDAIRGLSNLYLKSSRGSEAAALLVPYLAENPQDVEGQFLYGVILFNTAKQAEAQGVFAKVMELDASNNDVHYYLGMILVGQNKVPEALASLEKYLASNPTDPIALQTAQGLVAALKPKK
jgi:tetratricopeptide (TPR) repeat protein